eukprot:gene24392-10413_t
MVYLNSHMKNDHSGISESNTIPSEPTQHRVIPKLAKKHKDFTKNSALQRPHFTKNMQMMQTGSYEEHADDTDRSPGSLGVVVVVAVVVVVVVVVIVIGVVLCLCARHRNDM